MEAPQDFALVVCQIRKSRQQQKQQHDDFDECDAKKDEGIYHQNQDGV
jgi:hypothetical protein